MAEVIILSCRCEHEYQDQKYGKGKRVFNVGKKNNTCTVCGSTSGSSK